MTQKTPASKKTTATKQPAAKQAAAKGSAAAHQKEQDIAADRYRMIAEAAYLIAEQRGFEGDLSMDDWLQAEAEVDARFTARH